MTDVPQRFYTTEEAAALARYTPEGLRARRHRGLPPEWRRVGNKVLYPVDSFEAWLAGENDESDEDSSPAVGG